MPTLAWLLDPFDPATFLGEYWEARTLRVARGRTDHFAHLLSIDSVDRIITTLNLDSREVMLVDGERALREEDYTYPSGLVDAARVAEQFADGATIILQQAHLRVPELAELCRAMEAEFSLRFQTNVYVTPAGQAQGFKPHYDAHDVFVLQVAGAKDWHIFDTPVELPDREQAFNPKRHVPGEVTEEFRLRAGDLAYIPRGVMHDARSSDQISIHVTLGALGRTWGDFLAEAVRLARLDDPMLRRSLPVGFARPDFDRAEAAAVFAELMRSFVDRSDFDRVTDGFTEDIIGSRHALVRGQLNQVQRLSSLSADSRAAPRPALMWRLEAAGDDVAVHCLGKTIVLPAHTAEPVRFALTVPGYRVGDLPGDLDDDGKCVLIRRLVREGLVQLTE